MRIHSATGRVREAIPADAPFLAALYRSTCADLLQLGEGAAADALIALQLRVHAEGQRRAFPHARRWLLERAGRGVAAMLLEHDAQRLHVVDLATLPEEQGRGAATRLLRWAQARAAQWSVPLTLQVRRDQPGARRLYLALAFTADGGDALFERMAWRAA